MMRKPLLIFTVLLSAVILPMPESEEIEFLTQKKLAIIDKPIINIPSQANIETIKPISRAASRNLKLELIGEFEATAYDLSVESCGKKPNHPAYGITASGLNITGKNIQDRLIAADTTILPFNSKVYIEFPETARYIELDQQRIDLNGIYTVVDRGGAIKGNRIDIFFGEDKPGEKKYNQMCFEFGRQQVKVFKIKK